MRTRIPAVLWLLAASAQAFAEDGPAPGDVVPQTWLVLDAPDRAVRRPIPMSAVFVRYLLDRDAAAPREGDEVTGERGVAVKWTAAATKDGALDAGSAAFAFTTVTSDADRVVLAELRGGAALWVNGEPFAGNVYGYAGFPPVPVPLRKGENRVLVTGLRGPMSLALRPAAGGVRPATGDATRPGEGFVRASQDADLGVVVTNATDAAVVAKVGGTSVRLLPWGVTKVPCRAAFGDDGAAAVTVEGGPAPETVRIPWAERAADGPRRITRVSAIDGSVQEYAVLEPAPSVAPVTTRVVLTLHGAGVDSVGQARSYSRRPGFWIVAPTNRRPFGFDWQDWGRLDAYETLADATERFSLSSDRVYVTGHSMGGHGTWHLAANDPDRFLAAAPSAGWVSFDTYGGGPRPRTPLSDLWRGADGATDTLRLVPNLVSLPVFVLHGTADDNVPVAQAATMLRALAEAGAKPESHLHADAGHWWDGPDAPGTDCVDWPGIFALFERTEPAAAPSSLDWTTADPAIDSRHRWIQLARPLVYGAPTRIRASWDAVAAVCTVSTENAGRVNFAPPGAERWTAVIDGERLGVAGANVWFERDGGRWQASANLPDERKKPTLQGPLKRAFARRFAVVLPTLGDAAETRETTARVRADGQAWWVRGNGFWDVVLDREVLADPLRFEGRNLVLYGNADTNAAWTAVFGTRSPVVVRRGAVDVGDRRYRTDSAACFFVRPRADDALGLAAALGDTGPRGCRVAMLHALFTSGAGYPDYAAWDDRALVLGDGAVLAAGWFDAWWGLDGRGFFSHGGERLRDGPAPPK